ITTRQLCRVDFPLGSDMIDACFHAHGRRRLRDGRRLVANCRLSRQGDFTAGCRCAAPARRERLRCTDENIAAIGHQPHGLEDQEGTDCHDHDGQQADLVHAAVPRLRTRADNCCRADWTLEVSSTGCSMVWLLRATLVMRAMRSISAVPALT